MSSGTGQPSRGRAMVQKSKDKSLAGLCTETQMDGHCGAWFSVPLHRGSCGLCCPPRHAPTPDALGPPTMNSPVSTAKLSPGDSTESVAKGLG